MINRVIVFLFVIMLVACDESSIAQEEATGPTATQQADNRGETPASGSSENDPNGTAMQRLEESLSSHEQQIGFKILSELRTGDLDVLAGQRVIRVLTVYGLGRYYMDKGQEKGITYELFKMFEQYLNEKMGTRHLRIHVVFIPVARDQLIPALINGRGDIVAAGLTITPEREAVIDFTDPASNELTEVLVTGPAAPPINSLEDLAGHTIYVRASSSYRSSIDALNLQFQQKGLKAIGVEDADELLEDEDLLEMVNTGLLQWVVVDDYKAGIWAGAFDKLVIRKDLVFRTGARIGFGIRQNSPQLAEALNEFLKTHKQGTLHGNILLERYREGFDWTKNALADEDYQRFLDLVDIFVRYGQEYTIDYLMVAAQGYQESRLDQNARSAAGAIGIMQILPATAADPNIGIQNIEQTESNIHAGVKYLNFIRKRYFSEPEVNPFNQTLFAFAAYNAGPARVRKLRDSAAREGYDPNVWFGNVEIMAARDIGNETVQYVANILKYYIAYRLTMKLQLERQQQRKNARIN